MRNSYETDKMQNVTFDYCYEAMYSSLCVYALHFVKQVDVAEDLVQDVFVRFWDRFETFNSYVGIRVFLYQSTRNICLNHLEHIKVKDKFVTEKLAELKSDTDFVSHIIEEESHRLIIESINELEGNAKQVLILSISNLSNKEIAEDLNISINTVKSHKTKAYRVLRQKLKGFYMFVSLLH